ncbi:Glucokinase [Fusarium acuminatum]|uniref:Phosphotransferase n=1 Tax=Fusarium acuminatum TaxID=5515 RepID=A0ABZ2XBD3_9HYPO
MLPGGLDDSRGAIVQSIVKEFEIDNLKIRDIVNHFVNQIKRGLQSKHSYQIPSFVTQIPSGHEKGLFLAIDLGGTNCRVCAVNLHGDSTFDTFQKKHVVPSEIRVHATHKPLFRFIAAKIQEFLQEYVPEKSLGNIESEHTFNLGFTFSFTCEQTSISQGTVVHWDKGWDIPTALGRDPCALLQDAIDEINLPVKVCVLANDAVGTLLTRAYTSTKKGSALASIILGTGTNAAYVEHISNIQRLDVRPNDTESHPKDEVMVINTEWGCWDDELAVLPHTQYDKRIDETSSDPGCGLLEKMVSGMYLGELLRLALLEMMQRGALDMAFEKRGLVYQPTGIETAFLTKVTAFRQDDSSALAYVAQSLAAEGVTSNDLFAIQTIASAIVRRSARLVGGGLAAILVQSGRLQVERTAQKTGNMQSVHEISQKPTQTQPIGFIASFTRFIRHMCSCMAPGDTLPTTYDSPYDSKDTLGDLVSEDDVIDIAVDGSLFEFHADFENLMRSVLRDIPEIGVHNESRLKIELTRDGSGTGAALIAAVAEGNTK